MTDPISIVDKYKSFAASLLRNPDDDVALSNQFNLLSDKGDQHNAGTNLCFVRRAYLLNPDNIINKMNYAASLSYVGRFSESVEIYKKALESAPENWRARAHHQLGIQYRALAKYDEAIKHYNRAIELSEDLSYRRDRAMALMASGRLVDGLREFEIRRELAAEKLKKNDCKLIAQQRLPPDVKYWQGESLNGKTLVIYHEEGSGDLIQFSRFFPLLRERGAAKIYLTGPLPDLLELVGDNIAIDGIVPLSGPFEADFVVGSMSVSWRCGIEYKDVTGKPYFKAKRATFPRRGLLNVGLVWRGNPDYGRDHMRSMAFGELAELFDVPGIAFYSLQVGPPAVEFSRLGFDGFVGDLGQFATSWRKTASLIANLDVVVSVDTAVAHLAGALGVPVQIMVTNNSDWRWDRNNAKTVWYDSARVIRQFRQDEWKPVVNLVKMNLEEMLDDRRQSSNGNRESAASGRAA